MASTSNPTEDNGNNTWSPWAEGMTDVGKERDGNEAKGPAELVHGTCSWLVNAVPRRYH
jgi:hypothetical protein